MSMRALLTAVSLLALAVAGPTEAFAQKTKTKGGTPSVTTAAPPTSGQLDPSDPDDPADDDGPLRRAADDPGGVIVVGRQGSPVERPAHTRESYEAAVDAGADFIETEVVATQDGALVARADHELGASTDVADHPEFADRLTTKSIDGQEVEGWFTEDFTLDSVDPNREAGRARGMQSPDEDDDDMHPGAERVQCASQ